MFDSAASQDAACSVGEWCIINNMSTPLSRSPSGGRTLFDSHILTMGSSGGLGVVRCIKHDA